MKKKIFLAIMCLLSLTLLTACTKNSEDAIKFKNEYESINGKANANGLEHRTITIKEDNPYVYVTGEEIAEKIENKETFYVYFGSKYCPWCRSVVEKSIESANKNKIDTIYYVEVWGEDHEEIFRDKYEVKEDGSLNKLFDGTKAYKKIIKAFDNVLEEYNLVDKDGNKISVNEKRIYAPNFVSVKNGKAVKLIEGSSAKQKDSREDLTEEILKDEEKIFNDFFKN